MGVSSEFLDALVRALADGESATRWAAVATLNSLCPGWREDVALAERAVAAFLNGDASSSEEHLGQVLAVLAGPETLKAAVLNSRLSRTQRKRALQALASLGSDAAKDVALTCLNDTEDEMSWLAAVWLAEHGCPDGASFLIRSLSRVDRRDLAANLLGRLRSREALDPLTAVWIQGNTRAGQSLMEIDPHWKLTSEARGALSLLVGEWTGGVDSQVAVLDQLDPAWRHSPEARKHIPELVKAWAVAVTFKPRPLNRDVYRDREARQKEVEQARSRSAFAVQRLIAIDEGWQGSPEVKAMLPSLVALWTQLRAQEEPVQPQAVRLSFQAAWGPAPGEHEVRAVLDAADPHWYRLSQAHEGLVVLMQAWASGSDVAAGLDQMDLHWRESQMALRLVPQAITAWTAGSDCVAVDLDIIHPGWQTLQLERVLEQFSCSSQLWEFTAPIARFGMPAIDILVKRLRVSSEEVRGRAASLLAALKPPEAVGLICTLFDDPDFAGGDEALELLSAIGDASAIPVLGRALHGAYAEKAAKILGTFLKRVNEQPEPEALIAAIHSITDIAAAGSRKNWTWDARELARVSITICANHGDAQAIHGLADFLRLDYYEFRPAVLEAMLKVVDRVKLANLADCARSSALDEAGRAMVHIATDGNVELRRRSIHLLASVLSGGIASPFLQGLVLLLSRDRDPTVSSAAEAVIRNAAPLDCATVFESCREVLVKNLSNTDPEFRIAAAETIELLTRPRETTANGSGRLLLDLIALNRHDDAVRLLIEGTITEAEQAGEYRHCIEILTEACLEEGTTKLQRETRVTALNAIACYHWALGNHDTALALLARIDANLSEEPPTVSSGTAGPSGHQEVSLSSLFEDKEEEVTEVDINEALAGPTGRHLPGLEGGQK